MPTKLVSEFKHDDVFFHAPTFNAKGQKNVDMSYDKTSTSFSNRIALQLCKDTQPIISKWKLSDPREGEDGKRRNWELNISDPNTLKIMIDFDNYIMKYAKDHSREWFKKDLNKDQIEARYKTIVKEPKEGDSSQHKSMFIKINCPPTDNPTPIKKLLDDGHTLVDGTIDDLTKDAEVIPVIRTSGVWFMSDSFGVSFSAYKLIVKPTPKKEFTDHFILEGEYSVVEEKVVDLPDNENNGSLVSENNDTLVSENNDTLDIMDDEM